MLVPKGAYENARKPQNGTEVLGLVPQDAHEYTRILSWAADREVARRFPARGDYVAVGALSYGWERILYTTIPINFTRFINMYFVLVTAARVRWLHF